MIKAILNIDIHKFQVVGKFVFSGIDSNDFYFVLHLKIPMAAIHFLDFLTNL